MIQRPHLEPVAAPPGPARVLVVDDATVVRLYYRQILEAEGYAVTEAVNGVEGIEKALQEDFDLIVVDVNMPVMDGFSFLRELRRRSETGSVPALVTTTEAGLQDRRAALLAGANFFLNKPIEPEALTLHAAALLGIRRS